MSHSIELPSLIPVAERALAHAKEGRRFRKACKSIERLHFVTLLNLIKDSRRKSKERGKKKPNGLDWKGRPR